MESDVPVNETPPEVEETPSSPPPPPPPARWSERTPLPAAILYALLYLALAAGGGELPHMFGHPWIDVAVTLLVLATTVLSLLFVLSVCRMHLRPWDPFGLLFVATVVLLVARPEITLFLAQKLKLPLAFVLWLAPLMNFPGAMLIGNLALILWAALFGRLVSRIIREGNLLLPVAVAVSLVDCFTVFWGPVGKAAKEAPQVVQALSAQAPVMEVARTLSTPILTYIGIGDFLFLALFLTVAIRFGMRPAATIWATFFSMLAAGMVSNWWQHDLPGLPFITAGVLWVNRRSFHFSKDEQRALVVVGIVILALAAVAVVMWLRR